MEQETKTDAFDPVKTEQFIFGEISKLLRSIPEVKMVGIIATTLPDAGERLTAFAMKCRKSEALGLVSIMQEDIKRFFQEQETPQHEPR